MELRPLGFGEIFDRAITLYIRNFIGFAGIVVVVIVPLALVQYFMDLSSQPQWDAMIEVFKHPNAKPAAAATTPWFFASPGAAALLLLTLVVVWTIWPFALNACAVGVARLYRGRPIEFGACYRASLRRWPSVIGLLLLELLIFIAWYAAFAFSAFLTTMLAAMLWQAWVPAGVAGFVLLGVVILAALVSLAPLMVALTFAMNAIVIEERRVIEALSMGFARVFNREELWRSVLFAIASFAILIGAGTVSGVVAMVAMFFHWILLEVFVTSLFRAAITPFSIVLLAVYYFDVRIRREGLDMETELERLASGTAPLVT